MSKAPNRPRDPNQLAKLIADIATGEAHDAAPAPESQMAELGRSGGLRGGSARAAVLTADQRSEIAKKAAAKRWQKP